MNERIKELSKQAGDYVNETYTGPVRSKTPGKIWEDGHIGWHTQFNQKFAELIVKECVKFCEHESNDDEHDEYDMGMWVKAESIKTAIKQHFGVEE